VEQEMMGWQWHRLDHVQIICTSLQTDNHASTPPLFFTGWMPFLPPIIIVKALKAYYTYVHICTNLTAVLKVNLGDFCVFYVEIC